MIKFIISQLKINHSNNYNQPCQVDMGLGPCVGGGGEGDTDADRVEHKRANCWLESLVRARASTSAARRARSALARVWVSLFLVGRKLINGSEGWAVCTPVAGPVTGGSATAAAAAAAA